MNEAQDVIVSMISKAGSVVRFMDENSATIKNPKLKKDQDYINLIVKSYLVGVMSEGISFVDNKTIDIDTGLLEDFKLFLVVSDDHAEDYIKFHGVSEDIH